MYATVVHEWGGPEALVFEQVPDPEPAAGHVIVELRASSVNRHDVLVRQSGRGFSLPRILGADGAGVRRDTGEEVVVYPGLNWGDNASAPGAAFSVLGDVVDGTYAELVSVPEANIFPKPRHLSWSEAAALPVGALTAYRALFTRAGVQPGETVLVLGAGSGVSTYAVMLASSIGATALVTSSSPEKIACMKTVGASDGFLYTDAEWSGQVVASTGGVDVVIDGAGADLHRSLECLRPGGRVVVFGASAGTTAAVDVPGLYFGQYSVLGSTLGTPTEFADVLSHIEEHRIRPVIDSERPLSEARSAHEHIESRAHFGKLILTV
ncbi:zinc-binding dehydrogenase [Rhodococcus sp. NPDC127530]|uniref:zinc-binding dehydrogenase n=1 Tax=unclassified Rhodococcus (in: high G+C Gram-positive bacteria) TaxID=192944 RepID=UPI003641B18A